MKKKWKRILAAMIAASMIFANVAPAYATEAEPVVEVVEVESEAVEEEVSVEAPIEVEEEAIIEVPMEVEETTEEIQLQEVVIEETTVETYNDSGDRHRVSGEGWSVYNRTDDSGSHYLIIDLFDPAKIDMDRLIAGIDECKAVMAAEVEGRGAGYNYCRIEVQYSDLVGGNHAPERLWNTLVDYTKKAPAEETDTWFFFLDSYGLEYKYVFENTQKVEFDVEMDMYADVTANSATVTFPNTTFNADSVRVFFEITSLKDPETIADLVAYFGNESVKQELYKTGTSVKFDNYAKYFYEGYEESGEFIEICTVRIDDVNTLSAGTYEVRPQGTSGESSGGGSEMIYTGTVEISGDNRELYIRHWEVTDNGGVFDDAAILAALQARIDAGQSFEQVMICYPDNPGVVNKNVWNAVKALMNNDEWSAGFLFSGGDYMDENWFVAGMQETLKDVVLDGNLTLGAPENLGSVWFKNTNIPAKYAHIRFESSHWNDGNSSGGRADYGDFVAAFGTNNLAFDLYNKSVAAKESSARYEYFSDGPGNDNLTVEVDNVGGLRSGITYTLEKKNYKGETDAWEDGTTILRIAPGGFEECGETFTEDGVINILKGFGTTRFDRIEITYPLGSTEVAANVWNTAITKLSNSKNGEIMIGVEHNSNEISYDWSFRFPKKTSDSINLVAVLKAGNAGEYGTIYFEETQKPAEHINVTFYTNMDREEFSRYENAFGTESMMMDLMTPFGETVSNAMGHYNYYENDWGDGLFVDMNINFMDIHNLTASTTYKIVKHVYKGDTGTWDDGQPWININPGAAGKEFLTDEEVKEILENYEEGTFREITIEQNLGNELSADLANVARKYLAESTEEMASDLRFGFWNSTEDIYYQYCITNPGVQQENQNLSISYIASPDWEPKVKIGSHSLIGDRVWVQVSVDIYDNRAYYDWTINSLGARQREIVLEGPECPGWFGYDDWSVWLQIYDINNIDSDAYYKIIPKEYRGDINGDEEWQSLFISAYAYDNQKLEFADVKGIIDYYVENGIKFDAVEFEQVTASKNIIDKDLINLAREILKEDSEKCVTFIFCGCEENEDGRWIQKDWNWRLLNPGYATKDITATVTMSAIANKGATVKFGANTYNADNVFVQQFISNESVLAQDYHNALTADTDLMLLEKSANIVRERNVSFFTMGEAEDTILGIEIGNVQKLTAGTEYLICDINYLEEIYAVGDPTDMESVLSNPVDPGTLTWKVYSPEKTETTRDGKINFLNSGGDHYFSAQYKSDGKNVFEFFWAEAEVRMTGIAFEKSEYQVEFWPGDEDEYANRGYLDVKYYPSNSGIDPADLIWEIVDGEDVIRLVPREGDGRFDGGIQGLAEGTAIIKVTHPEIADLTDTVVVNVVEAVDYIPDEAWEDMSWLYAFADLDRTLADIELPENWRWANPKQSLKNYYDAKGGVFEAIYTKDSGKETKTYLQVDIFKLEAVYARVIGLEGDQVVAVESPAAIQTDETITWAFDWKLSETCDCEEMHEGCANSVVIEEIFAEEGRFTIKWSDNLLDIDDSSILWNGEDWNYDDCRMFKSPDKGTYKFNMSLIDNKTSKTVAKTSWSMKVVEKLVDFDQMLFEPIAGEEWNKGKLHFLFPVEEYAKISSAKTPITVKSSDSKVYAFGKPVVEKEAVIREIDGVEIECVDTWVTYEEKASGVVAVTVTAADDAKSTWTDTRDIIEREPKVLQPSVGINKAYPDKAAVVNVQFADNFPYAEDSEGIRVVGEYAEEFKYYHSDDGKEGWLCLENSDLAKGKYTVQLSIPVDRSYDGEEAYDYLATVKVNVTDKAPTVKFKQTKNVNLFYTNQSEDQLEGAGILTIDIGTLDLSYPLFIYENEDENVDEDFELVEVDDEYRLIYTPNDDGILDKKVDIKIGVSDSVHGFIMLTKTVTIKTEDKAPALVLSTKTDTLYPKLNVDGVEVYLKDKATNERLSFANVAVVLDKKKGETVELQEGYDWENIDTIADFTMSKNNVRVGYVTDDHTRVGFYMFDHDNAVNSTEKFTLSVCKENWSKPVMVDYTLKIATKAPKLKLGSSKLTLNMNEGVRNSQVARTTMTLENCSSPFGADVYFVGSDEKSKEVLNKEISLFYDANRGEIVARLNVSEEEGYQLAKGTYSFKVWADNWMYKNSTTLKITIVDTAPEKCIKLSKKGSIDLLMKDSTSIEFTPKMSNLSGTIIDAWVDGPHSYAFYGWYEDGKLIVQANEEWAEEFNTKHSYSLTPVFAIETDNGDYYEVRGTAQTVKVTQSKPKVTVNAYNGNTLYTLAGNELPLEFNAAVKNTDIAIKDVKLLNYTDDLDFTFYDETSTGVLSRTQVKQIATNGKSWSLKFAVTFVDSAGNEKPVQVTYKVTIK